MTQFVIKVNLFVLIWEYVDKNFSDFGRSKTGNPGVSEWVEISTPLLVGKSFDQLNVLLIWKKILYKLIFVSSMQVGFHTIQRHYCTYVWAVEIRDKEDQKRTRCNVKFSGTFLPSDYSAKYVLCYYSKVMDRVLGVSNVFRVSTNK